MTLRILLADDHAMFRSGLRAVLDTQPDFECVAEVADGRAAVSETTRLRPDVAILDVRMPKVDGLAAAEAILADSRLGTRVLVLTTFDTDEYVYRALAAGASGFLLKSLPPEELVAAIRIAARGDALIDPSVTHRLVTRFTASIAPSNAPAARAPGLDRLTARENEVLLLVAAGYSNTEIGVRLTSEMRPSRLTYPESWPSSPCATVSTRWSTPTAMDCSGPSSPNLRRAHVLIGLRRSPVVRMSAIVAACRSMWPGSRGSAGSNRRANGVRVNGAAPPCAIRNRKSRRLIGRICPWAARCSSNQSIGASAGATYLS